MFYTSKESKKRLPKEEKNRKKAPTVKRRQEKMLAKR
jgi:hypothetical protein